MLTHYALQMFKRHTGLAKVLTRVPVALAVAPKLSLRLFFGPGSAGSRN